MAATAARALLLSRFTDLPLKQSQHSKTLFSRHHCIPPLLLLTTTTTTATKKKQPQPIILNCLFSGIDGSGGVADDFVSTRKSGFDREFSVIANMLKRIEPLDTSTISKGVSSAARDSMKRTISSMLGLLPSDQFSVTVRVSRDPLDRLLANSIITGYTLWNAEYRVALTRNLDLSPGSMEPSVPSPSIGVSSTMCEERAVGEDLGGEGIIPEGLGDLSPEALSYIQELKSELATIEKELNAQKEENTRIECDREENTDLLEYLRSLEPDMVSELSRPSSLEVEDIVHQLVENLSQRLFKDVTASGFFEESVIEQPDGDLELCDTIGTSRDYLAKLLFWCMLLGHHLRGLENRLHLSCVVGLL